MLFNKIYRNPSEGIDLGFLTIHYYSLMFVVAFTLGWYLMKHIYEREGVALQKLNSLFIHTALANSYSRASWTRNL